VDGALRSAGFEVVPLDWAELETGTNCFTTIFFNEVWDVDHELVEANPDGVGADIVQALDMADLFRPGLTEARRQLAEWRRSLLALFDRVELLALPTLPIFPPRLEDLNPETFVPIIIEITRHTSLFNAAGTPCTAQPVPSPGSRLPASLQLVGPPRGEELLLTTALDIEIATS
jgi:Asp-tRNA(Asn)/Glu-tRNA(Gln) amidotransferase A subunit family amidase